MADHSHAPDHAEHVDSPAELLVTFVAVAALTVLNLVISSAVENPLRLGLQLAVGTVQAVIIARTFMHMRRSDTMTYLTVGSALFFMSIMFILILSDMLTRHNGSY